MNKRDNKQGVLLKSSALNGQDRNAQLGQEYHTFQYILFQASPCDGSLFYSMTAIPTDVIPKHFICAFKKMFLLFICMKVQWKEIAP